MIGTIRKHSKWLWWFIAGLTIISFIYWGAAPATRNSGGARSGGSDLGSIAGRKVTPEAYYSAQNEAALDHWLRFHLWPERDPNYSATDLQRDTYVRLLLLQKGRDLGIYAGDDAVVEAANEILSTPGLAQALGVDGQSVPMDGFVRAILQPKGMTAADFENFARHDLVIDQLREVMGLAGELITPQEAVAVYQRQNQELSAQIVFFSASNYLASVPVTPAAVDRFYTNYLAEYRLPDRVQVSYVAFPASNFMAGAVQKLTNLDAQVEAIYRRYGTNAFPEAKTPEEAKAKIHDLLIEQQSLTDARQQADDFANAVFNIDPPQPGNLATVAQQKGLAVHLTAPFSQQYGPEELAVPEAFTKAAFALTPDEPLAGPIIGRNAVYVIALAKQLPSEIPPLSRIRDQVTQDYQLHEATLRAQQVGTNFVVKLQVSLAMGSRFSSVCTAAGLRAESLSPFSLSTTELPELGTRATLEQLKSAAFATSIGRASDFVATDDGGFVVYVKAQLPVDTAAMKANLPRFAAAIRQQRQLAAYYNWLGHIAAQDLQDTPVALGPSGDNAR
ncbi:MAG TPA: SurA N-terminal domain-containing protein [Verrucomicrobiae bacterium]|nr:SurA N-terminal domain-containing protein [Verrucomicrobiae bacterium]